jgi:hypothetical protein
MRSILTIILFFVSKALCAQSFPFFALANGGVVMSDKPGVLTLTDSSVTVQAIFAGDVVEIMTVSDSQCIFGWFKIDDTQDSSWGITTITLDEVAVYGGDLFGGLAMAGQDKKTTTAPNPINTTQEPNWAHVDDTNGTSWTDVDSNQNC